MAMLKYHHLSLPSWLSSFFIEYLSPYWLVAMTRDHMILVV